MGEREIWDMAFVDKKEATIAGRRGLAMEELRGFNLLMERYKYFIFDCDGVIFSGQSVIGDSLKICTLLEKQGKRLYFYSNNSKRTIVELTQRFLNAGYHLPLNSLISTPSLTAQYLHEKKPHIKKVYLLGNPAFKKVLEDSGIEVIDPTGGQSVVMTVDEFTQLSTAGIQAVIVGCDPDFNYYKLAYATNLIRLGAEFIVADSDVYFPMQGVRMPAAAFIFYPIQVATGVAPTIICKPSPLAFELLLKRDGISEDERRHFLMIGDSLETDIRFGHNAGLDTLLVLSGVTKKETLPGHPVQPTFVLDRLRLES